MSLRVGLYKVCLGGGYTFNLFVPNLILKQYGSFSILNVSNITLCQFSIVVGVGPSLFLVIVFLLPNIKH